MEEMRQVMKLKGQSPELYTLVAPLVMSVSALRQNNNYPYKTSSRHCWYVLLEHKQLRAFIPLEKKDSASFKIDNYYAPSGTERGELLRELLERILPEYDSQGRVYAIVQKRDQEIFEKAGFSVIRQMKIYVKMELMQTGGSDNGAD
ncbi:MULTISPECIES: hypothetical protein [Bacteroides]|uniref:hypothetical protein n=1 Tax=Bacteroides TaxID=816 RepID=UPI001F48C9AE|nr:hypothetical protein [Bacteroides pyogenes]MCE9106374.1 hypothetical protein [Bacteroides pyogenes]